MKRRVPTVTQVTQTECGLCACVAVLRHHGRFEELSTARDAMDAGRDGLSAKQLGQFLITRGMTVKSYRVTDVGALAHFTHPVILYWEDYHFLVLERYDGTTAVVMDPAVGRRRLSTDELAAGFSAIVVAAEPGPTFHRTRAVPFAEWRRIPLLATGAARKIALVAFLSLSSYAAVLGIPLLTEWAVDDSDRFTALDDLGVAVALILAVAAGYLAIHIIRIITLSSLVVLLGRHLMTMTFTKLLALPYRFFATRQPGELLFRLNSINTIRDLLSSRVAQGILDIGTLVVITVYVTSTEWRLGLIAAAFLVLNGLYLMLTRRQVMEIVDTEIAQLSKSQSTQLDAIVSIPTIKMGGYGAQFLDSWADTYDGALQAMNRRMRLQQGRIAGVGLLTQMFGPIIVLLASLHMVAGNQITLGAAIAVQAVSATYFSLANSVFSTYTEFNEASRYLARIDDITNADPEPRGGPRTTLPSAAIQLVGVTFRYTKHSDLVINDVSLTVEDGSRVAIVGASGSGKSTLGRIMCGLYAPIDGTILFGGRPVNEFDTAALRRHIGYIPQEVHLHNRTILENLTMGQDMAEDDVREYCHAVGVLGFIENLPMGLRTLISEMGANFSGGQRQRLAIVRTLLQRPRILVMDEATASLDTVNERRVTALIEEMGATQVIIAHRLATVRAAHRIFVFSDGRIVEQGTHRDLLTRGTVYAGLYAEPEPEVLLSGGAS